MSTAASDAPHLVQRSRPDAQPRRLRSLTGGLSLEDSQLSSTAQGPRQPSSSSEAVYASAQDGEFPPSQVAIAVHDGW